MNGFTLFYKRLFNEWKFQYGVIKSIADWTILLYIILPTIAISVGIYRSWWIEIPNWVEPIPVELLLLIGYIFTWFGNVRTFVEEADKVFLIKRKELFLSMKKWSFFYSTFLQTFSLVLCLCILLPFFVVHFNLKAETIIVFYIYLVNVKLLLMYGKLQLRRIKQKYVKLLSSFFTFVVGSWVTQAVILLLSHYDGFLYFIVWIFGAIGIYFSIKRIFQINNFDDELMLEQQEKLKYVQLIYQFSYSVEKTNPVIRTRPFLFRKSRQLFKKRTPSNAFIELFFKVFLRNATYFLSYLQMIGVTISALIVSPNLWLSGFFFAAFLLITNTYLETCWMKITASHPLFEKYKEHPGFYEGKRKAISSLFLLAILITVVFSSTGIYYLNQVERLL